MVDINWGILRPVDIGGAFNQGVEAGRQRRAENALDEQFRTMAQNPNAPVSNDLLRFAPQQAYQLSQQQRQQQQQQQQSQMRVAAVQGDQNALEQLAGIDLEEYRQLRGDQREAAKQGIDTIGQLALMADNPQKWDSIVGQLAQADPAFQQYVGRFDMRDAIIAQAGQAKAFLEQQAPKYMAAPEGAGLINVKDPAAIAAWNAGATQPQAAPSVQDGATATNPQTGEKIVFRGGQWQPIGGAVSNGGSNFQ